MDELRRDINEAFEKGQAGLGDLGGVRERLVRNAITAPGERRDNRMQLAAGLAVILIAAVVVATFAYVRAGSQPSHSRPFGTATPTPTVSPSPQAKKLSGLPAGFVMVDADPISASAGWLLITNCIQPMTGKCRYSVIRTADGARTWSKAVQVGPQFDPANGDGPRTIRFMSATDGFVYGGGEAFVTHDGGRTWENIGLAPVYFGAAAGRGANAWVVTYPCAKGVVCSYEVRSSVDAGRKWSPPFSLPIGFSPLAALTIGSNGLLLSSEPSGDIEITHDGGASWQFVKAACVGNTYRGIVATPDGNELWELCLDYPNYPSSQTANERLFVSEDGGTSWTRRTTSQVSGQQVQDDYSTSLVGVRNGTALIASIRSTIKISHDAGRTWTQVGPSGVSFTSIRLANATDGWALDVNRNIWVTADGGDHWRQAGS